MWPGRGAADRRSGWTSCAEPRTAAILLRSTPRRYDTSSACSTRQLMRRRPMSGHAWRSLAAIPAPLQYGSVWPRAWLPPRSRRPIRDMRPGYRALACRRVLRLRRRRLAQPRDVGAGSGTSHTPCVVRIARPSALSAKPSSIQAGAPPILPWASGTRRNTSRLVFMSHTTAELQPAARRPPSAENAIGTGQSRRDVTGSSSAASRCRISRPVAPFSGARRQIST